MVRPPVVAAALFALMAVAAFPLSRCAHASPPPPALLAGASRLNAAALASHDAYDGLGELCDRIGHRLSGEASLDSAIAWAANRMRAEGLAHVHTERVMVPVWVRGHESAELLSPRHKPVHVLGLGMSVGTPAEGVTAEVVTVDSFPQMAALGEAGLKGRIVLYDVPFKSYGETVRYRGAGASRAARYGAVAVLVRAITPVSLDTPHTGSLGYVDSLPRIPAAAVTIEDATLLHRLCARGLHPVVRLSMEAHRAPDAVAANVIGEVTGRERPEEIVAIGGHIDSWDVGQGAQDDGVGCVLAMEAAHLMQSLGLHPRRTVRVVLWVNEENGLRGGRAYRDAHRDEIARHVAAIESDIGNGLVQGLSLELRARPAAGDTAARDTVGRAAAAADSAGALAMLRAMAPLLTSAAGANMHMGGAGSDVSPLAGMGVPAMELDHDSSRYFEIHHTEADTFDKIDPAALARNVATMAVAAWSLAEWPGVLRAGFGQP